MRFAIFSGEKTEKATPKKREETRKKGQTAKSQDVNTSFVLFAVFLFLLFSGSFSGKKILQLFQTSFEDYMLIPVTENTLMTIGAEVFLQMLYIAGPIMLVAMVGAFLSNYMQVGFLFSTEAIQPKLNKLDPIQGFKRIFSLRAIVELVKSILKISFIGSITFFVFWLRLQEVLALAFKDVSDAVVTILTLSVQMGIAASLSLMFLSLFDYLYQRYDFEKNIRMSKQDIKDEYKKIEGDPLIKSKIKQRQREMAQQRMMQEVPNADVVITNPTHFAIALKYDSEKSDAPIVVAKGVDYLAQKIKYIAKENDVVMVENRPLARALYDQADIGQYIPEEFFKTIAEILAYVYRVKNKL
ncbi:flagellar biosynthesis protein FlhB [Bacillus coahuilensis m2-6]|uniref:flagellar biosynthesis protein FlhB n=1 Tax=Bacillus coahuilensis TaxID=408580 RepID=UPI0007500D3D|nr:flagellar biosynthesis protein FlhB [Bacillus coahuilensis]KUP08680.1 flagellar biosynthesis protein FlhB [Bacillus coahuilensis m2-6]